MKAFGHKDSQQPTKKHRQEICGSDSRYVIEVDDTQDESEAGVRLPLLLHYLTI